MASSSTISAYNTNTNTGPPWGSASSQAPKPKKTPTRPSWAPWADPPSALPPAPPSLACWPSTPLPTDAAASSSSSAPSTAPIVWKVLILDQTARDILSPLLSVADLRDAGVTPIPDVPAVYFCDPTQAAIVRIAEDMAANLYDAFHLNFTSPLPRALLEDLAQRLVATGCAHLVAKVVDQYLPLRVLDQHLVSLALPQALVTLHSPTTPESELMALLDTCATGLLGVCITPVVLILDRTLDLGTPVAHSWLYAPLIVDVLEWKLNRVTCLVDEGPATQKVKKTFDIDVGKDSFWRASAGMPFPEVADMVDRDLAKYKRDAQEVLSATGAKSLEEMGQMDVGLNAKHLKSALTQLPALTARKRTLDAHMHIATALLSAIQARKLDTLYEVEQKPTKQRARDAARLAIVYINHVMHPSAAGATAGQVQQITDDVDEVIKQVAAKYPDAQSSSMPSTQRHRPRKNTCLGDLPAGSRKRSRKPLNRDPWVVPSSHLWAVSSRSCCLAADPMRPSASRRCWMAWRSKGWLPLTCVLRHRARGAGSRSPAPVRSGTPGLGGSGGASGAGAAGCIVFVVGGGSMLEYRQVLDVAKSRKRPVVYVGTEMGRPEDVVEMLGQLGRAGRS
ncbi:Sec1-like protein [Catenaria anguillulae PL171]|uniref:Sec1-like protein n=1 Tax=Catenaria anguillulae PL171 TaxID=765915 RepID=A0A1Y2HG29_9FUNG|nr:Sec1-like protein [Catenaria anguillulae PL171]